MMNKFEKKAILLSILGSVVERIEWDVANEKQSYKNIGTEEDPKWEWVDVSYDELEEKPQARIEAMESVIKHLEKLI